MKNIAIIIFIAIMLMSCTAKVPPTVTEIPLPTATQTATPPPTATPTSISWQWSNALVTFNDMAVLSGSEIWAIGQNGTIIHDRPQIMHLTAPYEYPGEYNFASGGYLGAIDFISENDGWLTASGGQIFHWDGQKWNTIIPFGFENPRWSDIDFAKSSIGWAAGCQSSNSDVPVLRRWNHNSWENITLSGAINDGYCLNDIDVVSETDVWIVGEKYQSGKLLHWDGLEWQEFPTPPEMGSGTAVSALDTGQVWVLGGNVIYYWDGSDWTYTEMPVGFWYSENTLAHATVLALSQSNVWVGGRTLFHWDGSEWKDTSYNSKFGYIVDIEVDPDGNIWALTLLGTTLLLLEE
jgi:hypothetical protein